MPKIDEARAAELLTVPAFVKAAQAGERWTDALVMDAVAESVCGGSCWLYQGNHYDKGNGGQPSFATGTDGRLLVAVLDALPRERNWEWTAFWCYTDTRCAYFAEVAGWANFDKPETHVSVTVHHASLARARQIAACAALLRALNILKET